MALEHILGIGLIAAFNYLIIRQRLNDHTLWVDISTGCVILYGVFWQFANFAETTGSDALFVGILMLLEVLPITIGFLLAMVKKVQEARPTLDFG